jgi:cytochrome c oxidase subunit 1
MLPFFWNVFKSWRYGEVVTVDDPWGHGNSLEWATSCPPPRHNFTELPPIRSERPAFELHYPHMVDRMRSEAHVGRSHRSEKRPVASAVGFDASKKAEFETAKRGQNAKNRAKTIDADGDV